MNRWIAPAFVLLFSTVALAQQPAQPEVPHDGSVIAATGCVQTGVESSCKVLKDTKTGDTYTLFFSSNGPKAGTAISFQGTAHQGMTTCMQGKPVDVTQWTKVKTMKCQVPDPVSPY
jgi:hypothetical protein